MAKYKITVSEPWNFVGPTGKNLIIGEIKKTVSSKHIVFESDQIINFGDTRGNLLLLMPRYEKGFLKKENNYETVGGSLLLDTSYEDKDGDFLEKNSKYVLIGSLEIFQPDYPVIGTYRS